MTKVCYVLSYKASRYVRTTALVEALKLIPNIQLLQARNNTKGIFRYLETFLKFLRIRLVENPDMYIIGFRGHEIYWFLRIFALKKIFIFDEMMSPYDSFVNEKAAFSKNSIIARTVFALERSILKNTNYVLTDTNLHSEFLEKTFTIDRKKIIVIPVGTDEKLFGDRNIKAKDFGKQFTVFFYATFLPLHGIDIVLKAAKLVEDLPIKFVIIGGKGKKKALREFNGLIKELNLKNIEHHEWVEFEELPGYIKGADLCLGGPFGGTPQARRVVTGKTYQFLFMGKATVVGEIEEAFGFIDGENCFLVEQNYPEALAEIVNKAYQRRSSLREIGNKGRKLFLENFSKKRILEKFPF